MTNLLLSSLLLSFIPATAQAPRPAFEVASVKPAPPEADPKSGSWSAPGTGRFTATHVSLALLIQLAYGIDDSQIVSKLGWLETNLYDVAAKPEDGVALTRDELKPRLQDLLQQRFHLVAHSETRLSRGYALGRRGRRRAPDAHQGRSLPRLPHPRQPRPNARSQLVHASTG